MLENIQRILVPVAFDFFSKEELITAQNLAQQHQAELHILHAYQDVFKVLSMRTLDLNKQQIEDTIHAEVNRRLQELIDSVQLSVPYTKVTRKGDTADQILAYAKENSIDLIVMSTHGRAGFESFFLGSVTQRIVRYAQCPVLTLRAQKPREED